LRGAFSNKPRRAGRFAKSAWWCGRNRTCRFCEPPSTVSAFRPGSISTSGSTGIPSARFLAGAINAMLGGWDHMETLAVLRLAPRFAASGAMDRFDFALREQAPNSGLGALKELAIEARAEKLLPLIEEMGALEEWLSFVLSPKDWARRFATLRNLFRPAVASSDVADRDLVAMWRSQTAALELFDERWPKPRSRSIRRPRFRSSHSGARPNPCCVSSRCVCATTAATWSTY
jgi:hypothetical protein